MSFGNGRIEEFYVACNCLSAEQMAEADVARALAAAMASFHFESLLHLPPQEATEPQASWRQQPGLQPTAWGWPPHQLREKPQRRCEEMVLYMTGCSPCSVCRPGRGYGAG